MHDMITSGSMAAASSPGFFIQEEARATEAIAARGAVDDQIRGTAFDERKIVDPYFSKTVMIRGEKAMGTHWRIMQAACSTWDGIQEEIEARLVSGADFEAKVCSLTMLPSTLDR
jgi:hypothetical protein